jgi:predicted DNA-binding transcriptional regulator AlpA
MRWPSLFYCSAAHPKHWMRTGMKHHLDKRAGTLAELTGSDDDLLNTAQISKWLGLSVQWFEIGRSKGFGPPFVKVSPRCVRYRRSDVREWLRSRTHAAVC